MKLIPNVDPGADDFSLSSPGLSPWWGVALAGLCYVGYFKGTPVLSQLNVDLTGVLVLICLVGVVSRGLRSGLNRSATHWVVLLWSIFAIGMVNGLWVYGGPRKILLMVTVTLLCAIAPAALLTSARSRHWFLASIVAGGVLMSIAAGLWPDATAQEVYGRAVLEGSNSIGNARVICAAAAVAFVFGVTKGRRRWLWVLLALGLTAMAVTVGSRGPFVSLVLTLMFVLMVSRVYRGSRRLMAVFAALGAIVAILMVGASTGNRSAVRIQSFLVGDVTEDARVELARESLGYILHNPIGAGWGGFSSIPSVVQQFGASLSYPHNMLLEIFVEGGWLAGIAFVVLVFVSLRAFIRQSTSPVGAALLALCIYWLLVAQTSSDVNGNRVTWVMLFLGLVISRPDDSPSRRSPDRRRREARDTIPLIIGG